MRAGFWRAVANLAFVALVVAVIVVLVWHRLQQ